MRVSCLPVSLFSEIINGSMSIKDWLLEAKDAGLDGVDISMAFIKNHTYTYLKTIKEDINEVGIPIVMATTYPDFTHPDHLQRKRELEYLRRDLALCSELKICYLRVLAGQAHPEVSIEKGIKWAINGLREIAEISNEYEVKLLYENHAKPSAWIYTDFSYPPDIFLEIYKSIKDTGIGINFDIGNIVAFGKEPFTLLEEIMKNLETIHVSDMKNFGEFFPVPIGTGVVPIKKIFSYLKERKYDKWLCIEEASFEGINGIRKAVKYVLEAWEKA